MAAKPHRPHFRDLGREEIDTILRRNVVARIAYTFHDRVDIEPVHYVYDGAWLYGRTSFGHKLATLAHHSWLAVEVDETRDVFDWHSVVVHGRMYVLDPEGAPEERAAYEHALHLLRDLIPQTLDSNDPVPFRNVVFRISVDEVRGREAMDGGGNSR